EQNGGGPFAVLQPFSSKVNKEWGADDVVAFSERLGKEGIQPVLRWGPGEESRADALIAFSKKYSALVLAPATTPASSARLASADGVPVHHIALTAESNDYVSKFYPVRTRYETWVDGRDFQPLRFEKHAREGRYESDEVEEFDLTRRIGSWREDRTPLPERVQDIISSFYFLRTQPLAVGQDVRVDMFSRGKIYKLKASILEREKVETEAGTFDAFKLQPQLRENETAEDRNRGKLFLWFSDDERRLPVMAKTVMPIGSVTARLRKIVAGAKPPLSPERAQKSDRPAAP
ncbi:MAG TPA: DUF3108 domain-containing protein, partial [Thermoanaerobaculia bacterium]|nr:DUF3108 domain-containing protein [Thermoanaerobaculia bacterium]